MIWKVGLEEKAIVKNDEEKSITSKLTFKRGTNTKKPKKKKKKHSQILILNVKEILKDLQILHTSDNVHNLLVYEIPVIDFKNNSA